MRVRMTPSRWLVLAAAVLCGAGCSNSTGNLDGGTSATSGGGTAGGSSSAGATGGGASTAGGATGGCNSVKGGCQQASDCCLFNGGPLTCVNGGCCVGAKGFCGIAGDCCPGFTAQTPPNYPDCTCWPTSGRGSGSGSTTGGT